MVKTSLNIKSTLENARAWILGHKTEFLILLGILLVASVMRFYRIHEYLTFLGDEGRDVIIVRRFLQNGDIMLIGPGTSIGNMYLGPLYYYLMAPFLWLFGYSPVGPAVMVATLSLCTVFLVWFMARNWFGKTAAVIASLLYAIAPTVIVYSRSSWNPNIMPFFALLAIWGIWKVWQEKQYLWLPVIGISIAFALQSHYLALILVPAIGLFWLLSVKSAFESKKKKSFILNTFAMIALFLLLMSPLVAFDIRHNYANFSALKLFFTERQTTVSIKPWKALPLAWPQLHEISSRLVTGMRTDFGEWAALLVIASAFLLFNKDKQFLRSRESKAIFLLLVWLGIGVIGLALYKQEIYDHYFGFLFPAPFLLTAAALSSLSKRARFRGMWLATAAMLLLVWLNLSASPLQWQPNRQLPRSESVSEFIIEKSNNQKFNFAVIAERNYEGAYQYFLEESPNFTIIDPQNTKDTITEQLFVVCELPIEKCDPTHNAKAEVANFGWSQISEHWEVSGVIVFKLIHQPVVPTPSPSALPKPR